MDYFSEHNLSEFEAHMNFSTNGFNFFFYLLAKSCSFSITKLAPSLDICFFVLSVKITSKWGHFGAVSH